MIKPIPRKKVEAGITLCLNKVDEYLLDAEHLISQRDPSEGTLHNTTILLTFAVEELGKAIILRKRCEEQPSAELVQVEYEAFGGRDARDHKQSEAFKLIDVILRQLHHRQDSGMEDVGVSPDTRLKLSFVDFEDGGWLSPTSIEPQRLRAIIVGAKEALKSERALERRRERTDSQMAVEGGDRGLPKEKRGSTMTRS